MDSTAFSRIALREITNDVREHNPSVKLRDAWVYRTGKSQWEFHYGEFYWYGRADDAYDARSHGWAAYLASQGVTGYTLEESTDGVIS